MWKSKGKLQHVKELWKFRIYLMIIKIFFYQEERMKKMPILTFGVLLLTLQSVACKFQFKHHTMNDYRKK